MTFTFSRTLGPAVAALALTTAWTSQGPEKGVVWTGSRGVTVSVKQIMARRQVVPKRPVERVEAGEADRRGLPINPLSPKVSQWPPPSPLKGAVERGFRDTGPRDPQIPGISFLSATLNESGYVPPDSMGDIGPTQILVCLNGRIKVHSRTGVVGALNTTTDAFFDSVRAGSGTSDPRVRYDRLTQRWLVLMMTTATPNRMVIAVSSGPTITSASSFTFYYFQPDLVGTTPNVDTGRFADYPTFGVDNNAIYVGCNMFATTFQGVSAFVVRKSSILSGGPIVVTSFRDLTAGSSGAGPFAPQGVDNFDSASGNGYFIGNDNASYGTLVLRRVSNPGGSPSISGNVFITVPTTTGPSAVVTLGSVNPVDALGDRLFAAGIFKNTITGTKTLWTAHNFTVDSSGMASDTDTRNGSRWYELSDLDGTPTLVQAGTFYDPAPTLANSYWIPTCAMSGQGHMAIGTTAAGPTRRLEIAVGGRLASDALGTTRPATTAQTSTTNYNVIVLDPRNRWGDYSFTSVDPNDNMTMWTVQEYCNATDSWGVRVIELKAPPPATIQTVTPNAMPRGGTGDLVVNGDTTGGKGFYDPGSGFLNRISASVGGTGVTVNSVTFNSPSQVVLNVTVAVGAATGARDITITNPDGQSTTGAGVLTITNAPIVVSPTTVTPGPGSILSGTVSSLFASDDDRLNCRPGAILISSQDPLVLVIQATAPAATASALSLVVESSATIANLREAIDVFNYTTNSYDAPINSVTIGIVDTSKTLAISNPNDHIGPANAMRIRIRYKPTGAVLVYPWQAKLDEVTWRFTP